jgi:hypothetical protein
VSPTRSGGAGTRRRPNRTAGETLDVFRRSQKRNGPCGGVTDGPIASGCGAMEVRGSRTPVLGCRQHASTGLVEACFVGNDFGAQRARHSPIPTVSPHRSVRHNRQQVLISVKQRGAQNCAPPRPSVLLTQQQEGILHRWQIKRLPIRSWRSTCDVPLNTVPVESGTPPEWYTSECISPITIRQAWPDEPAGPAARVSRTDSCNSGVAAAIAESPTSRSSPSISVKIPPASRMITPRGAMSQGLITGSTMTSASPRARSMYPYASAQVRTDADSAKRWGNSRRTAADEVGRVSGHHPRLLEAGTTGDPQRPTELVPGATSDRSGPPSRRWAGNRRRQPVEHRPRSIAISVV